MAKRKLVNIKIETRRNGYDMTVGEQGYFYFSLAELLEGFLYHVGLDIVKYADKNTIHDLILACATYPKEADAIKAVAKLKAQIEAMEQSHQNSINAIEDLKQRNAEIAEELAKAREQIKYLMPKPKPEKKERKNINLREAGIPYKTRRQAKEASELEEHLREKGVLK